MSGNTRNAVRRVDFGYFVRPALETGTGAPRVDPCLGYAIEHAGGVLLVDTGMGTHPDVDAYYHPSRVPLAHAVRAAGIGVHDVTGVVNCHLHFDHCGGNPELAGRPVFTQRVELESARSVVDYTLPELVDAPGLRYELLDGEAELFPGIIIVPTPGHTDGHQSVVVRQGDGTVVVAGQSHDTASGFSADALALRARADRRDAPLDGAPLGDAPLPDVAGRVERLLALDPSRIVFAHDHCVWVP